MAFTSLNPPPNATFTRTLSGQAEDVFAKTTKQKLPAYLQDRPLQFKSCWVSWLCLLECVVFAVWFAVLSWQESALIWLGVSIVFLTLAVLCVLDILEKSNIVTLTFSWRHIFKRTEFDAPEIRIRNSYAHLYKAPQVKAFTMCSNNFTVTQADEYGEITFSVPWANVRQIKPCLYFGKPAVGFAFYKPPVTVNPATASVIIEEQLYQTRIDELGEGYAHCVILTAPFALEPRALVEQAEAYAMFASEYYPGYG